MSKLSKIRSKLSKNTKKSRRLDKHLLHEIYNFIALQGIKLLI